MRVRGAAGPEGLAPTTDRFGTALSDISRCRRCGHMQLERLPSDVELRAAYSVAESTAYLEEERGQRATARRTLALIEDHAERGRMLDVGCWAGFLLAEARARGWSTLGVEPSTFAARHARDRLGLEVLTADLFHARLGGRRFDAVVLGDVIEHLPEPGLALERIAGLLAPGGVVALLLPDAGSRMARVLGRRWWSVIPTHVQYFTRSSIGTLLEHGGYRVLRVETAPKSFSVRYYLGRVGGYSRPAARALVRSAEALGLVNRMWAPDFRDRMAVVAARAV